VLLGIAGNIRDSFTLTACDIRSSANVRADCVMVSAYSIRISTNECDCFRPRVYDVTTGAKVRNTLTVCETELRDCTIHRSAIIKIITKP